MKSSVHATVSFRSRSLNLCSLPTSTNSGFWTFLRYDTKSSGVCPWALVMMFCATAVPVDVKDLPPVMLDEEFVLECLPIVGSFAFFTDDTFSLLLALESVKVRLLGRFGLASGTS